MMISTVARDTTMTHKPETRADRLEKLFQCARKGDPMSLEDRARLEINVLTGDPTKRAKP
jgi:hypothetical protein